MAGLYIHIPFCLHKCRYCDFTSYEGMEKRLPEFLSAMGEEILALSPLARGEQIHSVFVGGGTPSLMAGEQAAGLLRALRESFSIAEDAEITIESNPGTLTQEKLHAYREAGFNRLSIGLQSMDDSILARIGRIHTAEQFHEAFALARKAGFTNINVDVMHGLPGQTANIYHATLKELFALGLEHISAYELILEESTPLHGAVQRGEEALPDEAVTYDMQDTGMALMDANGYKRYEVSNFAKEGFACRHNINYWQNGGYLGIGAGAHSGWQIGGQWARWENEKSIEAYIANPAPLMEARDIAKIPIMEEAFECVMLGFRMIEGISLSVFEERFGKPLTEFYPKATEHLTKSKWLEITDTHARLSPIGLDMLNAALWFFLDDAEKQQKIS